ncbi:uncharacterized protein LOC126551236 isoform X2 [Aphis gossypii]|uniref:uncharacterized protein LOC126551236 isoform X2 n=1 Tax=Aphis gossypii TaxID=80765 RepID=UPI002158C847|nr:uncharacterized protein LOC126551236 isoform X2 [Aphis gossypii]
MGRVCCFYCQSTPSKIAGLTLHTLPTDKYLRNAWLKACGYSENDYSPDRRICSLHFEEHCYKATARKLLKPGSVPTKFYRISQYLYVNKPKMQMIEPNDSEYVPSCSHNDPSQNIDQILGITDSEPSCSRNDTSQNIDQILEITDSEPSCSHNDTSQNIDQILEITERVPELNTKRKISLTNSTPSECIIETPKRRRNRYVGDVTTPDLSTPKRAKENFKVAKLKIIKQRRQIKTLTQKVNRLQNKLSSLKTLFAYMKKQNLLSEVAHDNILVKYKLYKTNLINH